MMPSENQNNLMMEMEMDDMDGMHDGMHDGQHHMMDMDDQEIHHQGVYGDNEIADMQGSDLTNTSLAYTSFAFPFKLKRMHVHMA